MSEDKKLLGPDGEVIDVRPEDVEDFLPDTTALVVRDPDDEHEVFRVLDAHDEAQILAEAQRRLLKKSLYDFPQGGERIVDLSYQGVNEVIRLMNATGRCKIAVDPSSLSVVQEVQDGQPMWVATVYARDAVTGYGQFGTSTEPVRMKLRDSTANRYREEGKPVGEDGTVFDPFSRAKALNKAQRNALKVFIPEEIRQTLIAQYMGDSRRIERIQSSSEVKALEQAPPLTEPAAVKLRQECDELYAQIREAGAGRGKTVITPSMYHAWMLQAQGAMDTLERMRSFLQERLETIPAELAEQDRQMEAVETATAVACPKCEQPAKRFCKGIRGSHPERVAARLAQLKPAEVA